MNRFRTFFVACVGIGMAFVGITPVNSFATPIKESIKQTGNQKGQTLLLDKAIEKLANNDHIQLAGHYSHLSHQSHQSHQSHRSGY